MNAQADFDRFAPEYDFWVQTVRSNAEFASLVDLVADSSASVLELGCGTGQLALALADHVAHVTAIDFSKEMIALARQHQRDAGCSNVDFTVAAIEDWVDVGETYDLVVANYALHDSHAADLLPRICGLVRPGGRILIHDLATEQPRAWSKSSAFHRWRALKETHRIGREHGARAAARILRFRSSRQWISHVRRGTVLTASAQQELYAKHLPGSKAVLANGELTILWQSPNEPDSAPEAPGPVFVDVPEVDYVWATETFEKAKVESSLLAVFEQQVVEHNAKVAIETTDQTVTYGALNANANRLARAIADRSGGGQAPVVVLADDVVDVITAMLGVLKSGNFYVVLDPTREPSDLAATVADSTARLIVGDRERLSRLEAELAAPMQTLDIAHVDSKLSADNLGIGGSARDVAGVYYTSGTTGEPKGIVRTHRQLLHSTWHNTNAYRINADDRHSLLFFCGYTASVPDIFDTLLNGATLCPFDPRTHSLAELSRWLEAKRITLFHPPAAFFRRLLQSLDDVAECPELRMVIVAGQAIHRSDVEQFRRVFHQRCLLLYRLSMTEAGTVAHFLMNHNTPVGASVPVGYATADKDVILLDDDGVQIGRDDSDPSRTNEGRSPCEVTTCLLGIGTMMR